MNGLSFRSYTNFIKCIRIYVYVYIYTYTKIYCMYTNNVYKYTICINSYINILTLYTTIDYTNFNDEIYS